MAWCELVDYYFHHICIKVFQHLLLCCGGIVVHPNIIPYMAMGPAAVLTADLTDLDGSRSRADNDNDTKLWCGV
jgi:hypothetical protein